MRATTRGAAGARLREVKAKFAQWRAGCRGPGRVPLNLCRLAAEVAAECGIDEVARHLDIKPERLQRWTQKLGRGPSPSSLEFVELPPPPIGTSSECVVEIADPSGRKIQVSLKGQAVAQLPSVLAVLCDKRAAR